LLEHVRPARSAAHFAAVAEFSALHRAFTITPGTFVRRLSHEQAPLPGADQAYIAKLAKLTAPLTPGAGFGRVLDDWHHHITASNSDFHHYNYENTTPSELDESVC